MRFRFPEKYAEALLLASALAAVAGVAAILGFLVLFSLPLAAEGRLAALFSWQWRPFRGEFGILPMAVGSLGLGVSAMLLAFPAGVGICCFAHGLGPRALARRVLGLARFMAGVPTVVYGFVSALLLVPLIRRVFAAGTGFSWLAAAATLALLVLPTVVLLLDAQMSQIEPRLRLTAAALGFTRPQALLFLVLPACSRSLAAAGVLGLGRAMGDTLLPLMLAGNSPQAPHSLLDSLRTLTAHIALVVATDSTSPAYGSLFAAGLLLFAFSLGLNLALRRLGGPGPASGGRP